MQDLTEYSTEYVTEFFTEYTQRRNTPAEEMVEMPTLVDSSLVSVRMRESTGKAVTDIAVPMNSCADHMTSARHTSINTHQSDMRAATCNELRPDHLEEVIFCVKYMLCLDTRVVPRMEQRSTAEQQPRDARAHTTFKQADISLDLNTKARGVCCKQFRTTTTTCGKKSNRTHSDGTAYTCTHQEGSKAAGDARYPSEEEVGD